jgi:1-acyl-sn-glycerol-3-phosphate acyltransferase
MSNQTAQASSQAPPSSGASAGRPIQAPLWRRWFYRLITGVYFQRVTLVHPERLPKSGPVLYLGLHRNGAVDGFVYDRVLRAPVFMISTQLRKSWFARLFFDGIAVTRSKDEGDQALNEAALRQCLDQLRSGGELFVFPEGTSSLGPRHLPFKSGGIWLLLDYLENAKAPLHVIPLGIHYECAWSFRAKVEVVVGSLISTDLPTEASRLEKLKTMKRRVQAALEEVGTNVPSNEYQEMIQGFAYVATLGTPRSYFNSLKAMERAVPEKILEQWRGVEPELRAGKLWFHQAVPLMPVGPFMLYLAALIITGIFTVSALVLNLPPFLAGWYAGKKFPDDRNVISLWKILVGVPIFALWMVGLTLTLCLLGKFWWLAVYGAVTWLGLKCYYRFKKVAVAVHNGVCCPGLRSRMLAFHQTVLHSLPDETE